MQNSRKKKSREKKSRKSRKSQRGFGKGGGEIAMAGLLGASLGGNLYSLYRKFSGPKQGFVFTPTYEETGENCLLIIDPQVDFMEAGNLPVTGAVHDMTKLSSFIDKNIDKISSICVTLDTHSLFHIGNAFAYKGEDVSNYTTEYDPHKHHPKQGSKVEGLEEHIVSYAKNLEKQGKKHILWPLHSQLGTPGHAVYSILNDELKKWSNKSLTDVRYIIKGCDARYENFSVFRSAGVDKNNYSNKNKEAYKFNNDLAKHLYKFSNLYIAGEARTHCVMDSTFDYVNWVKKSGNPKNQQIFILWDCMSDIPGFEDNIKHKLKYPFSY